MEDRHTCHEYVPWADVFDLAVELLIICGEAWKLTQTETFG
jgi:hypothetical protein